MINKVKASIVLVYSHAKLAFSFMFDTVVVTYEKDYNIMHDFVINTSASTDVDFIIQISCYICVRLSCG